MKLIEFSVSDLIMRLCHFSLILVWWKRVYKAKRKQSVSPSIRYLYLCRIQSVCVYVMPWHSPDESRAIMKKIVNAYYNYIWQSDIIKLQQHHDPEATIHKLQMTWNILAAQQGDYDLQSPKFKIKQVLIKSVKNVMKCISIKRPEATNRILHVDLHRRHGVCSTVVLYLMLEYIVWDIVIGLFYVPPRRRKADKFLVLAKAIGQTLYSACHANKIKKIRRNQHRCQGNQNRKLKYWGMHKHDP